MTFGAYKRNEKNAFTHIRVVCGGYKAFSRARVKRINRTTKIKRNFKAINLLERYFLPSRSSVKLKHVIGFATLLAQ